MIILLISFILFLLRPSIDIFIVKRFSAYFVFFVLGASLSKFILVNNAHKYFNVWIAIPIMFFLHCCVNVDSVNNLIAISGIYLTISVSIAIEKIRSLKIISYIGSLSLIIYLFHIIPVTVLRVVLLDYFHITNSYLYITIQFVLTIFTCLLLNELLKKFRVRSYLFGR